MDDRGRTMADEIRREPSKTSISMLGQKVRPADPFHIVDTTTFGLFNGTRRVIEVISSDGDRALLGELVQRRMPLTAGYMMAVDPITADTELVFVPNINQPWGRVSPIVDWMRSHDVEIDPTA